MNDEEFKSLVLKGFKEMNERFNQIDQRFDKIDAKLAEHDLQFANVKSELADLKILSSQHHEELEKVIVDEFIPLECVPLVSI